MKRLIESLRNSTVLRRLDGARQLLATRVLPSNHASQLLRQSIAAQRLADFSPGVIERLYRRHKLSESNPYRDGRVGWDRYANELARVHDAPRLSTSLVLKEPGPNGEPGVLYVSFEYNWIRLLRFSRWRHLLRDYVLVGASSWSPTDFNVLASLVGASPHPIFIGVSNLRDVKALSVFGDRIVALPIMACDWVDPSLYAPQAKTDRDIDLLVVSHWGRFKRHHLLFEALRRLPPSLRVVLVGRDTEGRTAADLLTQAKEMGCRQQIETHTRIPNASVAALQCRAKSAAVFSAREGSCVAITEAMAADTPVMLMRDAHVGSAAHINSQTGALLDRRRMWRQIGDLIEGHSDYQPRRWMRANISAQVSTARLEHILSTHPALSGTWSRGIAGLRWVYVPAYLSTDDRARLQPVISAFGDQYGVMLEEYPEQPGAIG